MIAATSLAGASLSNRTSSNHLRSSTRPYGAWKTPGSSGPKPAWYFAFEAVSETGAVGPAVERAQEGDDVRSMRRVAGQLDRRLDDLGAGVAEIGPGAALDRRELGQPAADLGVDRQVEVARAEVDQLGGLLLDRRDDLRMRVAGRVDRDAGGEVEEQVAVDVLDGQAVATDRHDRVGARQARRRPGLIERDVGAGLRAGQLRDDVRDGPTSGDPRRGRRQGTPLTTGDPGFSA